MQYSVLFLTLDEFHCYFTVNNWSNCLLTDDYDLFLIGRPFMNAGQRGRNPKYETRAWSVFIVSEQHLYPLTLEEQSAVIT